MTTALGHKLQLLQLLAFDSRYNDLDFTHQHAGPDRLDQECRTTMAHALFFASQYPLYNAVHPARGDAQHRTYDPTRPSNVCCIPSPFQQWMLIYPQSEHNHPTLLPRPRRASRSLRRLVRLLPPPRRQRHLRLARPPSLVQGVLPLLPLRRLRRGCNRCARETPYLTSRAATRHAACRSTTGAFSKGQEETLTMAGTVKRE